MTNKIPKLDLPTRTRLIESNTTNYRRITAALLLTLAELEFVQAAEDAAPGSYTTAITKLQAKRDRQDKNAQQLARYIAALKAQKD